MTFKINYSHMKKIILIFSCFLFSISSYAQDYSQLYLVGAATSAAWDNNAAIPMNLVAGSDAVYSWTGNLNTGDFKFINVRGSWTSISTNVTITPVPGQTYPLVYNPTSDFKFTNSTAGIYTLVVDMKKLTMSFAIVVIQTIPDIWAVGTALPGGKVKMIVDQIGTPNQFKYMGQLIAGGTLKFITTETEGTQTKYFVPSTANKELVGLSYSKLVSDASNAGWSVANSSNMYKIKLDLVSNTATAEIYKPWTALYIAGNATTAVWDPAKAIALVQDPQTPYIFTYEGDLKIAGGDQFKFIGQKTGWNPNSLHPTVSNDPIIGFMDLMINIGDNKWTISSEQQGKYLIKVDLFHETINATFEGVTIPIPSITNSTLNCNKTDLQAAYNLAINTVSGNVLANGTLAAGAEYNAGWTRDCSMNMWNGVSLLNTQVAQTSMWSVTNNKLTIGAEYWDRIIWVIAALNHYKVTGDVDFLKQAYKCSASSMTIQEQTVFDTQYGMFKGPSVFNDGIAGYPTPVWDATLASGAVVDHPNSAKIKCLSTNCIYYQAYVSLAKMAQLVNAELAKAGQPAQVTNLVIQSYLDKAATLKVNILKYLYSESDNQLYYLIDNTGAVAKYQEGLGVSYAIMFGIITKDQAQKLLKDVKVSRFGITDVYPDFPRFSPSQPGRHNNIVWPQVNGFFAKAAILSGDTTSFMTEFRGLTSLALDRDKGNKMFYEVYNPYTGVPDGGWQQGTHWSPVRRQTWCATAYIDMVHHGLIGMRFEDDGVSFSPYLPVDINNIELKDLTYRQAVLDIVVKGQGTKIKSFKLNGVEQSNYRVDATAQGTTKIEIEMESGLTLGLANNSVNSDFSIYPTVIKKGESLTINTTQEGTLKIFTILGSVMVQKKVHSKTIMPVNLPVGSYFIQFGNQNGTSLKTKIVIL